VVGSSDPLWLSIPNVVQALVTTVVAAAAGAYGYYRFLHRKVSIPKVEIEIAGTITDTSVIRFVVMDVSVANVGETMLTIVPDFTDGRPLNAADAKFFSGIQVYGLSSKEVERMASSQVGLVWDYNPWVYSERLNGQWMASAPRMVELGPGRRTNYPFAVPLPWKANVVFVNVYLGVVRGEPSDRRFSERRVQGIAAERILQLRMP
jgi:hypothetical protein